MVRSIQNFELGIWILFIYYFFWGGVVGCVCAHARIGPWTCLFSSVTVHSVKVDAGQISTVNNLTRLGHAVSCIELVTDVCWIFHSLRYQNHAIDGIIWFFLTGMYIISRFRGLKKNTKFSIFFKFSHIERAGSFYVEISYCCKGKIK